MQALHNFVTTATGAGAAINGAMVEGFIEAGGHSFYHTTIKTLEGLSSYAVTGMYLIQL